MPIIIDGYNFIGQCRFTSLADPQKEEKLLQRLSRYHLSSKKKLTVVFDGQQHSLYADTTEKREGITIRYSPEHVSADDVIKAMLSRIGNPKTVTVITADQEILRSAKQARCRTLSPQAFERELHRAELPSDDNDSQDKPDSLTETDVEGWLKTFGD